MKKDDDEYPIKFHFTRKFYHVPVKDIGNNNLSKGNTKELTWANLYFHGECIETEGKLACFIDKTSFLSKKRSSKITLKDRFEKSFEEFFKPNERYEHFNQLIETENTKKFSSKQILLSAKCKPIEIEETTTSVSLTDGKRKFFYHYYNCEVVNTELIGDE